MKILTFIDHYLPGHRAGGPVRSVSNMVSALPSSLKFRVVTRDRDLQDSKPYRDIKVGSWNTVGLADVLYLPPEEVNIGRIVEIARADRPDVVYLNGLFSRMTLRFLLARRLGRVVSCPVVLAPRGELSPGALRLKGPKKRAFLALAKVTGLFARIVWHASTELERMEILDVLGDDTAVSVARNLVEVPERFGSASQGQRALRSAKTAGSADFAFVSRISPKKNLLFALRQLARIRGDFSLNVYGPAEDAEYWERCKAAMGALPPNARVRYMGAIPPEQVGDAFGAAHFFVFPTLGENFGHVIFESLAAGCPVVLSDTTPWELSDDGAGWTIPLAADKSWVSALQSCVDMNASDYGRMVEAAPRVAEAFANPERSIAQNVVLFTSASSANPSR